MSGLMDDDARQALAGRIQLAALEAERLQDDPLLRDRLADLADLLAGWKVAGDQAQAVRLRLLEPDPHPGYTEQDLASALADYRFARGCVLTAITAIHDQMTEENQP